jgi:hypothetical protein
MQEVDTRDGVTSLVLKKDQIVLSDDIVTIETLEEPLAPSLVMGRD